MLGVSSVFSSFGYMSTIRRDAGGSFTNAYFHYSTPVSDGYCDSFFNKE